MIGDVSLRRIRPTLVGERVAQFRDQVGRRLSGELTEDQFRPLRLMNGLYLQLHAYMLRVAIPYGTLSSRQMRKLAHIARRYDKGYGHFTTRQNIQYNWPTLKDVPDILAELAEVEMHAIQTSGNCIRNVTADHFAGAAADEIEDPRLWAEMIRQWSTLHPEFSFLPRKFKIAVTGAPNDRAADRRSTTSACVMRRNDGGEVGFEVMVGGGLGRTPMIGKTIRAVPAEAAPAVLPGGDPARLQPVRPARQQVQGAHQDPGPRDRRRGVSRAGRGGVGSRSADGPVELPEAEMRAHRRLFRAAAVRDAARRGPDVDRAAQRAIRTFARWARHQRGRAQAARLRHRQHLAEAASAARRATPPPSRWTPSPISPTATASARSASPTSRTSSCRMSARRICSRSGRRCGRSASRRRTSA